MKKKLLSMALCATVAVSALAEPQMVASYQIGDVMGGEGIKAKTINYYDAENKLLRAATTVTDYTGLSYVETIVYYVYDQNGLLLEDYSVQYRPAYGDYEEGDHNYYQYDEQGRLIQYDDATRGYQYKYDADGNRYYEKYYSNSSDVVIQEITFSDYDANGNPATAESDGYNSDYRFDAVYTYDELGRCVEIMRHCVSGTVHSKTEYTYDEKGIAIGTMEYISAYGKGGREGGEVGGVKDTLRYNQNVIRKDLGNGWYQKEVWTWDTIIKDFMKGGSPFNELYMELNGETAPRNIVAENISTTEQPNTAKVTAEVPTTLPCENVSYIIWRNGVLAATVTATDGKIEFIDSGLENDTYEYVVMTYDATNDVYYNTSDVATVEITVPLSEATNIRVAGGYWGKYSDSQTPEHDSFYVKLAWDVADCGQEILGYKVWLYPWAYAMYEIDGDTRTIDVPMTDATAGNFRIDVVYELGVKEGSYVPLFWDNTADFEGEPKLKYYLTYEESYGDHMGGAGASGINYYIYDSNNNLSRRVDYGYQTDGSTVPTYNYFYEYNSNGQLISEFYRQMNAMGEWGKNRMPYVYTYNAQGQLTTKEDTVSNRLYEYFYDEEGRLVTETDKGKNWGSEEYDKLYSTTTYSQFNEQGLPEYVEFVHAMYASSCYNSTITYDEKGRVLIKESRTPEGLAYEKFVHEYDAYGIEINKTKFSPLYDDKTYQATEQFVLSNRTVREDQGNKVYKRYEESYDLKSQTWYFNGRYTMEYYSPLNGSLAPQNLVVSNVSTPESPNTIEVECNFPQTRLADAQYIIWRGWIPVDTVTATAAQGAIRFRDADVENGTYEYIVQTYDAATGKAFNATAPCKITMEAELNPVSNLRYISQTEGEYKDPELGKMPAYWIHFEWDAPETTLPIICYNIYQDGFKIPVATTTNCNDSVWVYREEAENIANQQMSTSVEVKVLYSLGESEGVTHVFEVKLSSVENISLAGSAYVAGKTLYVEPQSQVTIYNVAGAAVATYNNNQAIDLSAMPSGVYVAVVKIGNAAQVLKVAL